MLEKKAGTEYGNVHYWVTDKRIEGVPWLFMLHGLTANHTLFDLQVRALRGKYNLLVWDAPRHGKSRPFIDFSYSICADAMKQILDQEDIPKVILIGHCMGGYCAQMFLSRYADSAKGFISIDSTPFGKRYYSHKDLWWYRQVGWWSYCYPYKALKKVIVKKCCYTEDAKLNLEMAIQPYDKEELSNLLKLGYMCLVEENRDLTLTCPILLLVGDHDRVHKVRERNEAWSKQCEYDMIVIRDAGHNAGFDNAQAVNEWIEAFVSEIVCGKRAASASVSTTVKEIVQ